MKKYFVILWFLFILLTPNYVLAVDLMLPYQGGSTWIVSQGNSGTLSHKIGTDWEHSWDFAVPEKSPVLATADGKIVFAGIGYNSKGEDVLGNTVIIDFGNGEYGRYCHLLNTETHPLEVEVNVDVSQG